MRVAIEELRCNWSNKKLGLPHENDLPGRSVGRSVASFFRVSGDGKKFVDDNR